MIRLPISKTSIEVKKPDTNTILKVSNDARAGKVFSASMPIIKGCTNLKPEEILALPILDVEVIVLEAFRKYDLPMEVDGLYSCPRIGCGGVVIHDSDTLSRPKYTDFEIKYLGEDESPDIVLKLNDLEANHITSNGEEIALLSKYTFRQPTLGDMINIIENAKSSMKDDDKLKTLYISLLKEVDGLIYADLTSEQIINRYKINVLNFEDYRTFNKITVGLRAYGIQPYIDLECPNCGKEWKNFSAFASFFAYALTSVLQ
jgi:hypothetical protein